jgi:hypothetical protein
LSSVFSLENIHSLEIGTNSSTLAEFNVLWGSSVSFHSWQHARNWQLHRNETCPLSESAHTAISGGFTYVATADRQILQGDGICHASSQRALSYGRKARATELLVSAAKTHCNWKILSDSQKAGESASNHGRQQNCNQ